MSLKCSKLEDKLNSIYLPWKLAEFLSCPRKLLYWRHFLNVKHFADWIEPNSDMITIPFWKIWNWNNMWITFLDLAFFAFFKSFFKNWIYILRRHEISQHFPSFFEKKKNKLYILFLKDHLIWKLSFYVEITNISIHKGIALLLYF